MRILSYYVLSLFGGLFAVPLSLLGAKSLVDAGSIPIKTQPGHPTPLSFFIPLIGLMALYIILYGIVSIVYSRLVLSKKSGRLRHFLTTAVIFVVSVASGVFLVVMADKLLRQA